MFLLPVLLGFSFSAMIKEFLEYGLTMIDVKIAANRRWQGLNASENFLDQFNNPSSSLLGTINAIYE